MSKKLEDWLKKIRDNSVTNEQEILQHMRSHAVESDEPYRLEVVYNPEENLIIIQGNQYGLAFLLRGLESVINASFIGAHYHYDTTNLTKADASLIIQKVADTGDGTHTVE